MLARRSRVITVQNVIIAVIGAIIGLVLAASGVFTAIARRHRRRGVPLHPRDPGAAQQRPLAPLRRRVLEQEGFQTAGSGSGTPAADEGRSFGQAARRRDELSHPEHGRRPIGRRFARVSKG